jgi:hypothetical protein
MEPEGSLSLSQKPATGPYPEADKSSLHNYVWILGFINS